MVYWIVMITMFFPRMLESSSGANMESVHLQSSRWREAVLRRSPRSRDDVLRREELMQKDENWHLADVFDESFHLILQRSHRLN